MISEEVLHDLDLLTEKLVLDAYTVRDNPSWKSLVKLLQTAGQVGEHLQNRLET